MFKALAVIKSELDFTYPLHIGEQEVVTDDLFRSFNPCRKRQIVGTLHRAGQAEIAQAIEVAEEGFRSWRFTSADERAGYLFRAAEIMRRRRFELSACMVLEVGKSWPEADADTAEAIDFLEFYGREMLRYAQNQPLTTIAEEKNELSYIPLGVGAIIPPWNFPLAILTGMTSAAIVTGNCVLLKPATDSPVIAHKFFEVMTEAKLPPGVLNFVPGSGSVIGDFIVAHPRIRFISFTGSKEVGLRINQLAAEPQAGQIWIKRVSAEMGGKDGIIVDREANLASAAEGTVASAFGFQGQKCSACSRVIVDKEIYDEFLELLVDEAGKITVGPVENPEIQMGAVINHQAFDKTMSYIDIGHRDGRLICGGEGSAEEGYFIQPTIFADVEPESRLAQEEIFAPVLAVIKANDYDHALKIANGTEFGLTGAVYTENREKIERAKREFHVGNLYFNRGCTGALVGVHPFGGFNMSGTNSKAGGRDYLSLFLQAKLMSEKVD
jgi:1-pyrroline-5-carboxylate dehydrogenase